jgi:hypothetical protein
MQKVLIALLAVLALGDMSDTAQAQGERFIAKENISVVAGLGASVAINSTAFQSTFDEGLMYALRAEYRIHPRIALYGDYSTVAFDPVAASDSAVQSVEVSSAAVGVMLFGTLNATNTVLAFLDVGVSSNTIEGQDTEFKARPGGGLDISLSPQVAFRPAVYVNRYAGNPEFVDGLEFKAWLRITPFATTLF